jgi:His/Glu/Gln/Arg/opine family amino acid ABC transporter permease subunit
MSTSDFIRDNWLYITAGLGATLGLTVLSFLLATPLAILTARGRRAALWPVKALSTFYVWLIDGIPLLLQIPFVFLALPQIGIVLPGFWGGIFVLTLNYGSRMSKIFYERFAAPGKRPGEAWTSFVQPLTDEFTSMIKDTTLISLSGLIYDVYWRATKVGRAEFKNLEALTIAAIIYLILITIISLGAKRLKFVSLR